MARVNALCLSDEPSIQRALRVTLVAILVSALAIAAFTRFTGWFRTPIFCLLIAASCVIPLVMSRSGRIRRSMLLPLLTISFAVLYQSARSSGITNIGLAVLPVLIMVGSLVLDRVALVAFTAALNLSVFGVMAIRYFVTRVQRFSMNDMADFFIFTVTCAAATLIGRLHAVRIEEGFRLIRESERRYRDIFDNVQDLYYEMRPDGTLLEINPASSALLGVPRQELIGRPMALFCVSTAEFDALLAEVRACGRVSSRELVIRDSNADLHHVLVNASLQASPNGSGERVIGSICDISARKRAEKALLESERKFRDLLEGVQLVALMTDLNGEITFWNDYAFALTGWSKEEVIGRSARELLRPESLFPTLDQSAVASPLGQMQPFVEGSILEKSGARRLIQWSRTPVHDAARHVVGFACLGEDVSELRALRTEAARGESEEQFREVADAAPLIIWTNGPDGRCTFVNKAWLSFTGRPKEKELGYGWIENIHPEDREPAIAACTTAAAARRDIHVEYRKRRADGEYRWVLGKGVPRFRSDGEFMGYVGSCYDLARLVATTADEKGLERR